MYAVFRGVSYPVVRNFGQRVLISYNPESVKNGFYKWNNYYRKPILDDAEIEEIYDARLFVEHDTGIEGVPSIWEISLYAGMIENDSVRLEYVGKTLPDWECVDKGLCTKYVGASEIKRVWIEKTDLRTKKHAKAEINVDELMAITGKEALGALVQKHFPDKS